MRPLYTFAFTLCLTALVAPAQDNLAAVEKRLTEFTLSNGWKFIVLERHQAPVAAFYTYADVGSDRDVRGITGMAHMFEHMAFKGSKRIGTKNYAEEVKALARVDDVVAAASGLREVARDRVVPRAADDLVVAQAASQRVVPAACPRA